MIAVEPVDLVDFWRREEPELSDPAGPRGARSLIRGGMWDYQREWWDAPEFFKLLVSGYGGGKTITVGGKRPIYTTLVNAPVPTMVVSPTFPQAKKTVIPTLIDLLRGKQTLWPDLFWDFNKTEHRFRIRIGDSPEGTLWIGSAEDPDALKGPNLGAAYLDEPFLMGIGVLEQMSARVRHPEARIAEIGMGGTPEELNWGYELAEGELRDKYAKQGGVCVVRADTRQNKALPEDYALRLLGTYDDQAARAYVAGQFVSLSKGRVFYAFDSARNVKVVDMPKQSDGSRPPTLFLGAGMDFNVNPMAFCAGWRQGDHIHVLREWEQPNSDTEQACGELRDASELPGLRNVYPDPSGKSRATNAPGGKSDFDYIRDAGFIVHAPIAQWPLRDSINAVNAKLARGELTIDPRCKRLIRYLMDYAHEKKNEEAQKAMSHLLDALRYWVTYLFPIGRHVSAVTSVRGL